MLIKKILISIIIVGLLVAGTTQAVSNLWELFQEMGESLPTIEDRIPIAETCGIEQYTGTIQQNSDLLECLFSQGVEISNNQKLGATIPKVVASYESSLASKITSSATSLTLVSGVDDAGTSLSGYICFVIDEGTASREFVCGTASGTAISSMIRGIDMQDGNLEVTALKKSHRRGASIKISDYPILGVLARMLNGDETLPNIMSYASALSFTAASNEIPSVKYVDDTVVSGAPVASFDGKGIIEMATQEQLGSGAAASSSDSNAFLVASSAFYNVTSSATTSIPVTDTDGKLQQGYYDLAEAWIFTGAHTLSSTLGVSGVSTLATTSISDITISNGTINVETFTTVDSTTTNSLVVSGFSKLGNINEATINAGLTWSIAQDLNNVALTNANIDSGNITVTETTSTNLTVTGNIIGGTVTQLTVGAGLTWNVAQDLNSVALTNVNIDSGNSTVTDATSTNLTVSGYALLNNINSGTWQADVIADTYVNDNLTLDGSSIDNSAIGQTTASTSVFSNSTSTNLTVSGYSLLGSVNELTVGGGWTWSTAQDMNNVALTNINIDSGAILVTDTTTTNLTVSGNALIGIVTDGTWNGNVIGDDYINANLTLNGSSIYNTTIGQTNASTSVFTFTTSTASAVTSLRTTNLKIGNTILTSTATELNKLDTTSANVTATNLNTLTDGSSQTSLHRHGMSTGREIGTADGELLIPHGLGVVPTMIEIYATVNKDDEAPWSIGTATSTLDEGSIWFSADTSGIESGMSTTEIIFLDVEDTGADLWHGDLTTLDATNIGITLVETGTIADIQIQWKAWY